MKKLGVKGLKVLKVLHLLFIMMWAMGVAAMAIISSIEPTSGDGLYIMLHIIRLIDDTLVIPGAMAAVITAIVYGIYTNWGFFKYRWITVKWIISILLIILGTFYFSPKLDKCINIVELHREEALNNPEVIKNLKISLFGAYVQSSILIFLIVISVFKPWKKKKSKINI
ncbi:MAG: hypothetical protein LIO79_06110 [Rikenellaceae bacterium]|nr:hypothetical protein [Rikenellaceae bacterium]